MEFVRTPAATERIEERVRAPQFDDATVLSVRFRTDPTVVEELLPPGLAPADEPLARAEVVHVGASNCVGAFHGGGLYVRARHGDREGEYCLSMPMSTDAAVRWGRATLGEPKKLADVTLTREGDAVRGRIERDATLLAVDAELAETGEPRRVTETVFHYKYQPALDGRGFHADPALVGVEVESELSRVETGTAALRLGSTPHDPLGSLPVETVAGASYATGDIAVHGEVLTTVDPAAFRPYAWGVGMDDWLALGDESGE